MSIRVRLSWTFILLIVVGVTAISSYNILIIRNFLTREGKREMKRDGQLLAQSFVALPALDSAALHMEFQRLYRATERYQLAVLRGEKTLLATQETPLPATLPDSLRHLAPFDPVEMEANGSVYVALQLPANANRFDTLVIHRPVEELYAVIRTIRWIIYSGMFLSIAIVVVVSTQVARRLTKPIIELSTTAKAIAGGDLKREIHLNRKDEFGELAQSLSQMARTLLADNERLSRLNDELRRTNDRQRQFYADIAHEIRNPLHTVLASLEMVQLPGLDEEKRARHHATAQAQLQRISRLFNDLMTLQRADADPLFVLRRLVDARQVADRVVPVYAELAARKGLTLDDTVAPHTIFADPHKLEQVLDNLLSNAVKYTERGRISLKGFAVKGGYRFEVEDTGLGIAADHLPRITDRFYRADTARARDRAGIGGTGLGLAVVDSILTAHESQLEVWSEEGTGSGFAFTLPESKVEQAEVGQSASGSR